MKKEYVFTLILAILCFLGGNYYSSYNHKEQTLFVYKGTTTERENTDLFQSINYSDSAKSGNIACKVAIPIIKAVYGEQQLKSELPLQITLVNNKYWTIEGTLHTSKGGVVFMTMNKNNGCVLKLMHSE